MPIVIIDPATGQPQQGNQLQRTSAGAPGQPIDWSQWGLQGGTGLDWWLSSLMDQWGYGGFNNSGREARNFIDQWNQLSAGDRASLAYGGQSYDRSGLEQAFGQLGQNQQDWGWAGLQGGTGYDWWMGNLYDDIVAGKYDNQLRQAYGGNGANDIEMRRNAMNALSQQWNNLGPQGMQQFVDQGWANRAQGTNQLDFLTNYQPATPGGDGGNGGGGNKGEPEQTRVPPPTGAHWGSGQQQKAAGPDYMQLAKDYVSNMGGDYSGLFNEAGMGALYSALANAMQQEAGRSWSGQSYSANTPGRALAGFLGGPWQEEWKAGYVAPTDPSTANQTPQNMVTDFGNEFTGPAATSPTTNTVATQSTTLPLGQQQPAMNQQPAPAPQPTIQQQPMQSAPMRAATYGAKRRTMPRQWNQGQTMRRSNPGGMSSPTNNWG